MHKKSAHRSRFSKCQLIIIIVAALLVAAIITTVAIITSNNSEPTDNNRSETVTASTDDTSPKTVFYSKLTGEEIANSGAQDNGSSLTVAEAEVLANEKNQAPLFCIQIPNGNDGARPQVGLNEAKIIFEAVAEAGITRFAAIFQNPTSTAIGPIRSLRSYYLQWDTPFDCTIIHAGGEANALKEVAQGYKHLSESKTYMWRSNYGYYRAPNNLFSDATLLKKFNSDNGYNSSDPKVWPRLTPEKSATQRSEAKFKSATSIKFYYSASGNYNPVYAYDKDSNTYLRSFENGKKHSYHACTKGSQPKPTTDCGQSVQAAPSVVVAMKVKESTLANKREKIETVGSGEALIFQNGLVIPATWTKKSISDQIVFTDESGAEISLAPGQTWISAIPDYHWGKIKY